MCGAERMVLGTCVVLYCDKGERDCDNNTFRHYLARRRILEFSDSIRFHLEHFS